MTKSQTDNTEWLDDLVVTILAPYEYVAMAMLSGTKQNPLPIRNPTYVAYMKKHKSAKSFIQAKLKQQDIKSRIDELTSFYDWVQYEGRIHSEIKEEYENRLTQLKQEK